MKKIIVLLFFALILVGCDSKKEPEKELDKNTSAETGDSAKITDIMQLEDLPKVYSSESAIKNNDYVVGKDGEIHNDNIMDDFLNKVDNNEEAFIRIVSYSIDGGARIYACHYDKDKFNVKVDQTRWNYETKSEIEMAEYKYLKTFEFENRYFTVLTNLEEIKPEDTHNFNKGIVLRNQIIDSSYYDTSEWINPVDSVDLNDMNLYWHNDDMFFDADENAMLSIYVNAEKDDNGVFGFDDRHEWLLIMETQYGCYPLFPRQYLNSSIISCTLLKDASDTYHILIKVSGSYYRIFNCIFDNDKKAFKVEPLLDGMNYIADSQNARARIS